MGNLDVHSLSTDEMGLIDEELAKLYGAPLTQEGMGQNAALNSLFKNYGAERRTNTGRKIISGRVFKKMLKDDIPFDDEYVYMQAQDGSITAVPARKYTKYLGTGRRIVDDSELEPQSAKRVNTKTKIWIEDESYSIYFCDEKYDCKRFFDSERGRNNHWKVDHEGAWTRKANKSDVQQ